MKQASWVLLFGLLAHAGVRAAEDIAPVFESDPHRNELGFFDVHICNWPDRPLFIKTLFSTAKFKDIKTMEVFAPNDKKLTDLSLQRFKPIQKKGKPEKRVYMVDMDMPADSKDGWYYIVVKTNDGKEYRARDFLVINRIGRPGGQIPAADAEDVKMPKELKWDAVPGAAYYKVFIRDGFENTLVLKSKLLREPRLEIKPGLLKPGGYYTWMVHARDVDENIMLGDFNSGSINQKISFSIAEE